MPGEDVPSSSFLEKIHFDKIVHFGMFAVIVLLSGLAIFRHKKNVSPRILASLIFLAATFGFMIELLQKYYAIGRSFDLFDLLADTLGAIAGAIALKLAIHWWYKPKTGEK